MLIIVTYWLLERGKKGWFTFIPAVFMLLTTGTMLVMILIWPRWMLNLGPNDPIALGLIVTDLVLLALTVGIVITAGKRLHKLATAPAAGD